MTPRRLIAFTVAGLMLAPAPVFAGSFGVARTEFAPPAQAEKVYYRRYYGSNALPAIIAGGLIAGVVGGALGGGCYFNDCAYDYDTPYYGGGYYSGSYGHVYHGGGNRGRGFHGGGNRGGGFHGGGNHGGNHGGQPRAPQSNSHR